MKVFPLLAALTALTVPAPLLADVVFQTSGISAKGTPVAFQANLDISGDLLVLELWNQSPVDSLNPDDTLSSFYFDILQNNARPNLAYQSATGNVYLGDKDGTDPLVQANANLVALNPGDDTWQFKTFDDSLTPFLGFGVGTVGNGLLTPNNFNGVVVGAIENSIYKGQVTTSNLNGRLLVKEHATYVFSGLTGFSNADIARRVVFGLGTGPDSLLVAKIPEPGSAVLLAFMAIPLVAGRRRRAAQLLSAKAA